MTTVVIETRMAAPIELCFDLARDVDTHIRTSAGNRERAVGGKTSGLLDLGDSITWEAVHFLVRQRLTSRIVEFDRPWRFVDEMVSGAFASLRHVHEFSADGKMRKLVSPVDFELHS
jgi:ligand-binding SRPBCC domain-containing protein